MMNTQAKLSLLSVAICMTTFNANAALEIYENDGMSFSADGLVNAFYANSSIEKTDAEGATSDRDQSSRQNGFPTQ